jgi:hypothetical protein
MLLLNRLTEYAAEVGFAFRVTRDLRDGLTLSARSLLFHLENALARRRRPGRRPFGVGLRLPGLRTDLTLRQDAGDLFVLYEVLMQECYRLPESLCDPATVRTVVDCGANIGLTSLYLASRYPTATIYAIEPHPANYELLR